MATVKIIPHAQYLSERDTYCMISDFVDGAVAAVSKYLIPYQSETGNSAEARQAWSSRLGRLTNENECDPPLQVNISHLAQPLNFGALADSEAFSAILDDVTGYDTPAQEMFAQLLSYYLQHGKVGVLIDAPGQIAPSRAQARAAGERSYQVLYLATDIIYWDLFRTGARRGQFRELVLRDEVIKTKAGQAERLARFLIEEQGTFIKQLLELEETQTQSKVSTQQDKEYNIIDEQQGSLEEIPFVLIGRGLRESALRSVAQINKSLLNDRSILDNVLHYTGYQRSLVTGTNADQIKSLNEFQVTCIDNEKAQVHTIEAADPSGLFRRIAMREQRARRIGLFEFNQIVSDETKDTQSAESKSMDMKGRIARYNKILDLFTKKLNKIYLFHAFYEGVPVDQVQITIPRDFGIDDPDKTMANRSIVFSQASQLGVSEVQKQVLKQGVQEMRIIPQDGTSEEEAKQALMTAIDGAQTELEQQQQVTRNLFGGFVTGNA